MILFVSVIYLIIALTCHSFVISPKNSSFPQDAPVSVQNKLPNSEGTVSVAIEGEPKSFQLTLSPYNMENFSGKNKGPDNTFVSLLLQTGNFKKYFETSSDIESGLIIIQTDKTIYSPGGKALIRVISLNDNGLPLREPLKLQIRDPEGLIVEERTVHPLERAFVNHTYEFPRQSPLGEWSIHVFYGYQFQQNTSIRFDLLDYVLPTFTVRLTTPSVIFPDTNVTQISVHAEYANGEKVTGFALFRIGLQTPEKIHFITRTDSKQLTNGSYTLELKTKEILKHARLRKFEDIQRFNLFVEAVVEDIVKGMKKMASDNRCRFLNDSLRKSTAESMLNITDGFVSPEKADITPANDTPSSTMMKTLEAHEKNKKKAVVISKSDASSDRNGNFYLELRTNSLRDTISIKIGDAFTKGDHFESRKTKKSYYPVDEFGDEYYPGEDGERQYEKDDENNEIYAIKKNGDQFYLTNNGTQIYARNKDKIPYYSKLFNGRQIYAEMNGTQFYIKIDDKEEYAKNEHGNFYYALDLNKSEIYARNKNDEYYINNGNGEVYALDEVNVQRYAKRANLDEYFATNDTGPYYAKNGEKEIYPKTVDNNEYYMRRECVEIYAFEKVNRQYYAQMENDFQVAAKKHGAPYYAKIENSAEVYPYDQDRNQYYIRVGDREVYARDEDGDQYYAKKITGDEFYAKRF